jgi:glucose-6-phosphate isomerase
MKFPSLAHYGQETGFVEGVTPRTRHLGELAGKFLDDLAYQQTLQNDNPIIYSVSTVEPAQGDGQLHYGIGKLMPGKIGSEYYFTLGHLHAHRPAAEVYLGISGEGLMLLQHESTGETQVQPLKPNTIVYVPGYTAHRTVNTGDKPLIYLGVYPAQAGHDYGIVAKKNFNKVVLDIDGKPVVMGRQEACQIISKQTEMHQRIEKA